MHHEQACSRFFGLKQLHEFAILCGQEYAKDGLLTLIESAMAVDLSGMRDLYKDGALKTAFVSPAPMEAGAWVLTVELTDGSYEYMTVARKGRHKIYKSLDAVSADAQRVGFDEVRLNFKAA
ncbi:MULTISPECIES: hypothetical protein [Pseudomonas syringae group]|uniref:hypothetical protein n=1 Tax=Pseudomonas syringae group TaxID=136849 RepID=UPI001E2D1C24|nr:MULTISPECIES: hypothetical protein [Pseudomonas syringae group]